METTIMTEADLIRRAQAGDGRAIQALYRRHSARVFSIARRLAGDDAAAEDWAQDAWVQAIRALPDFRGRSRFSTWLYRIALNRALQGLRRRRREEHRESHAAMLREPSRAGEPALLRVGLERALDRLPPGMRTVLVLHDVEGYTHAEIAERLGVTEGTSKSQLFKARARMRELLRSHPGGSLEESYVASSGD
jgi:RNA polymerase sigma-70 factor, ECF subfamily